MAYRDIDRKRFTYLLNLGTDDFELRRFFRECRAQLIQHGGKVQNLPHGSKARIRTLAVELPPSTDEVVRGWFSKHLTMVDPEEAETVVDELKAYEELGEELPEDSARRLARSCLVHLFGNDPPQSLLDFLKTPIGGHTMEQEDVVEVADSLSRGTPGASYPDNLPQVLIDLVEGKDADEHLEGLPPDLVAFISGLQSGAQGDTKEAREAVDALPADSALRSRLEQFLRQQEAGRASKEASSRGLRMLEPELFEGSFDYEIDEVLAYCTKADKPAAVFVHPIAVVRSGRIQRLTDEKRRELFPETGDVIAFATARHPRQPRRGEVGIWQVAAHETHKATRFHLASEKKTVYEVRSVPFPSTDYDSVREFLKEHPERSGGNSLQPFLFLLSDELIIGGRSERLDLSRDETFESGVLSWNSLPALRLEGRLFVAGPLPKEHGIYECAGLGSTVRKFFKSRVGKVQGGLTRAQLSDLAQSLGSVEAGLNTLRVQRIRMELERLVEQQEAFDALMEEVMIHPSVKQQIDQRVEQEASRQLERKNNLQADIDRLQKESKGWEERVRKQRDEYRKLPHGISKAVKAAFERARADGLSTLAELAVFQALSESTQAPDAASERREDSSRSLTQPMVRDLLPSNSDPVAILKSLGVPAQRATAFAVLADAARRAGLMVCVRGVAARPAVEAWARAVMQRGVLLDTTVGLVDDAAMRDVLAKVPAPDGVALLDANLSALDVYARPLSDLVLARLAEPTSDPQLAIFLGLADGVAALPLPRTFERISLMVDLDARYVFRDVSEVDELMAEVINPDDGTLYARLWRPAADRLRGCINEIEPQQRALVLSVLASR